jgi:uncharacterized protein YbjT (DUF2867 family)
MAEQGDRVTVISRHPVDLPALWLQGNAVTGEGLRKAARGCQVLVYAAAGGSRLESTQLAEFGVRNAAVAADDAGARLVVVGPAGTGESAHHPMLLAHHRGVEQSRKEGLVLRVVRLPALFGEGDHLLTPWLDRASQGKAVRVPRNSVVFRPLWTLDAALLVARAMADDDTWPDDVEVKGPGEWTLQRLAKAVCGSWGTKPSGLPQIGGQARWDHLAEQATDRDDWATLKLPQRQTVQEWLAAAGSRS